MEKNDVKKYTTFKTMVVTQPPKDQWDQFVIKKNHMNPRIKRPPFPHITLLSPFYQYEVFANEKKEIENLLKDFKPFTITFKEFMLFENKKSTTLYLHPKTSRDGALTNLFKKLYKKYPDCVKGKNFKEHIGIGYFKGKDHLKKAKDAMKRYQKYWKEIKYECSEVYLISRVDDVTPFEVRKVCQFGSEEEKKKRKTYFKEQKEKL